MYAKHIPLTAETPHAGAQNGLLLQADARSTLPELTEKYAGKVQCVYIDPPFASGQVFQMRVCRTPAEWKSGLGSLTLPAYRDKADLAQAQVLLRELIIGAKKLLSDTGLLFVHVDWRLSGRARVLLDELFGEDHIVNEIIWSYQTGGRAKHYFSRKHDTIFLYRKGDEFFFDGAAVAEQREGPRRSHMRREVDSDGRTYRTIRSGGRIYTYYDDEPVVPGDVWDDLQMQQRDPQRTGYETQKPLKLMERIIGCSTKPGDIVADLCSGSGTTLEAAFRMGRQFIGIDPSPMALLATRRRLFGASYETRYLPPDGTQPCPISDISAECTMPSLAELEITLHSCTCNESNENAATAGEQQPTLAPVDGWAAGYLRSGTFIACASAQRTRQSPSLQPKLTIPYLSGELCLRVSTVYGETALFSLTEAAPEPDEPTKSDNTPEAPEAPESEKPEVTDAP